MHPASAKHRACILAALMLATTPLAAWAQDSTPEPDEATTERMHDERLRRLIEKREAEQTEYARRRDNELGRQTERARLQARISVLERDESMLQGQMRNAETQLLYSRRDPADMSAHARRSELESRMSYYRSQLVQIAGEKQIALRQLNDLRLR